MNKLVLPAASFACLLLAAVPAAGAVSNFVKLECGAGDHFDINVKYLYMIEQNGDAPTIVYSHLKITDAAFGGDAMLDGKTRAVLIDRKTGQLRVSRTGIPAPEVRTCTPFVDVPPTAPAPTNKF